MKAVTLRNIPPDLAKIIRRRAEERRTSINRAIISLLEEHARLGKPRNVAVVHHDLDALAGSWTNEEAAAFDKALNAQRRIDPELWK